MAMIFPGSYANKWLIATEFFPAPRKISFIKKKKFHTTSPTRFLKIHFDGVGERLGPGKREC